MPDLSALAALLLSLSELHHDLGQTYAQLAAALNPAGVVGADALALARAIQGEEAGRFGDRREELGELIAHTALNRWDKPWWHEIDGVPCTFEERVEYDWHGAALVDEEDLEPWAIRVAYRVMEARREGGEDLARGALFAMGLEDLQRHGWTEAAHQVLVRVVAGEDPLVQFWFMSDHPAPEH